MSEPGCLTDSDNDGIKDSQDFCNTPDKTIDEVNEYGFPNPIMTEFEDYIKEGFTTNLSYENLDDLSNFSIGIVGIGKINFVNEKIRLFRTVSGECNPLDLDRFVTISNGNIEINSDSLPELNRSAIITMYNIVLNNPYVTRDGVRCDECNILSYSNNTLIFSVSHFSSYNVKGEIDYRIYIAFLITILIVSAFFLKRSKIKKKSKRK